MTTALRLRRRAVDGSGPVTDPTAVVPVTVDETDRQILRWLVRDGRVRLRILAATVALSQSAVSARIHRLQDCGVVTGFQARLDLAALGRPVRAVVHARLRPETNQAGFERFLATLPGILDAWLVTGDTDYQIHLACRHVAELEAVLAELRDRGGAARTSTTLLLRPVPGLGGGLLDDLNVEGRR